MKRETPAALSVSADTQPFLSGEPSYNLHDIMVKVTGLPSAGFVLKADSLTPVVLGDALTAAELAALTFAPTSLRSEETLPGNGLVIYVPQDCGRLPIPLFADLAASTAADTPVVITELPSNGSVFLADGMTAVVRGQAITAAQLCGLTFHPAADAVGQISLLRYRGSEEALTGEVLLVVGPAVPSFGARETAATGDDSSVSPIAIALLLEAGLSSLNATQASAAVSSNDLLPPDSSAPSDVMAGMAGMAHQISERATGFLPDHIKPDITVPASAILAQAAPTGMTDPTGTDTSKPRHHIGSSSPPDFGSLKLVPLAQSTTLTSTSVPGSFEIANNAVLEIKGPSGRTVTFDTGNGELILDRSAQFHGLIGSSSPTTPLSPNDLIDLKDLPFTASMSASVHYDSAANISTVDFSNGSKTVTLQFSGQDLNWIFKSDAQGGTIVADPPTTNPIVLENQKQGTPQSVWQINPGQDSTTIQGFTTAISTNVGGTVAFKIDNLTGSPNYHIDIYRLGYYGGDGATLETTIQHLAASAVVQPAPLTNPSTGLVDAGNWSVTDSWTLPSSAISGVYIANVIDGSQVFEIPFIVRNDSSHSDIVFQTSDQTWQAYNPWGGANLYAGNGPGPQGAAYAVSYNRPITTRDGGLSGTSNDMVFSAEYPAIYWLEENGYDVSYISGIDAATNGALLLNHKVYLDVGHDEYWTDSQRANVQAAANAGVNLTFLSGNEVYWQTRLAPSIDGSATANRTLVSYKDTHANAVIDPTGTATGTFMDARFASSGGMSGQPSNSLTGTVFQVDSDRTDILKIPYGETNLRFWRNTSVANTAPGQSASLVQNLLGYEWDSSPDNGFRPSGLVDLSSTTLQVSTDLLDYGNTTGNGTATHNLVEFRDPTSGALIFGAGTVFWSWGLASDHDQFAGAPTPTDPNVQQATVNLFADMGVQPLTLQASLVIATQSTDHTPPASKITQLSATSVVEGQSVTVSGTASDVGGVIGGVEVSTDGGKTWHPATGTVGTPSVTWSYTFTAGAPGTVNIESRAVDDSLNLETPGAGVPLKVTPSSNLTIFSPTDTPAVVTNNDPNAVELGVKFVSAASGEITGIRFYKGVQNTGTHLGDLWTSTGTLLASATFSNETASGWQQVNFATPVHVQAGVTYIASYHTNTGEYSTTDFYFDNSGHRNGALTATGSGLNGVYAYGTGPIFPSNVSITKGDNFWVDVVFNDTSLQPQANNVSGFTVTENGTLSIAASALLANDTDPSGLPFSITSVSNPVNGTVSYNAQTQIVTFTPSAGYAGAANFTYTITDSSGASGSGQVSLNVNYPLYAQSLFGTNDTPSLVNSGDSSSTELGVKFTASANGVITGIRFYKGSANTGPHLADLWSAAGTLLATATFTNETASGWQEVNFSTPVAITAGTTYVASYHTNGNYSASQNYFANSLTNGELTAPGGVNGLYTYGSGSIFPTNTYKASNYWVDVVFDGSNRPVANNDSGFVVNENGSITIAASALLANDTDTGGLPISITGVSNPINGTVSYDANARTVTFVPTTGYNGTASFTYTIGDTNGGTASASVALFVNNPSAEDLFSLSSVPSVVTVNDPGSVELGVKFAASADGLITGLRFYKGPQNTGPHVADLWSSTGTLLATATFSNETASGWQQANFSSPVAITAGTTYVASYHSNGDYSTTSSYFTSPLVSGDLTAPASGNGVYAYGSTSIFPTNTYNASNYWVDVVYTKAPPKPVANNDSGFVVNENGSITIAASALLANDTDTGGLPISITGVSNPTNGTVSYDANAKSVTFVPTAGYAGTASFTYSIADSGGGTASASASLIVNDPSTTSLFNPASAPSILTGNDPNAVEIGFKFQASTAGTITGLRFYKGPQNTGTHVADLWSSTGTQLATATFTNETAGGWQQVNFAAPVAITAGTTYVASYHTNGNYSADPNLFATAQTNGPLTAPSSSSSGGNGVYAYGSSSLFPTNSFNSTSYGVDVLFKAQLAA
jgi:Domain of unknown function (DUF4082)/Cadherin-like domain